MELTEELQHIVEEEESALAVILDKLESELKEQQYRLRKEELRSRDLTSAYVNAPNVEDKQLIASDEAVSHTMRDLHKDTTANITRLLKNPYFGRLVVEEELKNGDTKEFHYFIGITENSSARILDWRKAPLAKLFYEYREGEFFDEEIHGKERSGKILTRRTVKIKDAKLIEIRHAAGVLQKSADRWTSPEQQTGSLTMQAIAHLLDKNQFKILEMAEDGPLFLQGVPGSGKTTLALHRLAWLLERFPEQFKPENALILMCSEEMAAFCSEVLPELGVENAKVLTVAKWLKLQFAAFYPETALSDSTVSLKRVLYCQPFLEVILNTQEDLSSLPLMVSYLRSSAGDLERNELLGKSLTSLLNETLALSLKEQKWPSELTALAVLAKLRGGTAPVFFDRGFRHPDHLIVDEVQQLDGITLAALVLAGGKEPSMTMVGDTAQAGDQTFPGWKVIQEKLVSTSTFRTLELSYRSTLQIRRLAAFVRFREMQPADPAMKQGRSPLLILTSNEEAAVQQCTRWLNEAITRFPDSIAAVLCPDRSSASTLYKLLTPHFGERIRLARKGNNSFEPGIVVTSADNVRGLEFESLVVWDASGRSYPANEDARASLYVSLTRARTNLAMISWNAPSTLFPSAKTGLLRVYDARDPEE